MAYKLNNHLCNYLKTYLTSMKLYIGLIKTNLFVKCSKDVVRNMEQLDMDDAENLDWEAKTKKIWYVQLLWIRLSHRE